VGYELRHRADGIDAALASFTAEFRKENQRRNPRNQTNRVSRLGSAP
jgi:hypothetical protein